MDLKIYKDFSRNARLWDVFEQSGEEAQEKGIKRA